MWKHRKGYVAVNKHYSSPLLIFISVLLFLFNLFFLHFLFSQIKKLKKSLSLFLYFIPPPSTSIAPPRDYEMVGLSVILENHMDLSEKRSPQVIRKGISLIKNNGFLNTKNISNFNPVCGFLDFCFLCNKKLLPDKDIYMYKGDKAFCSEECRCRQIFMDEEETNNNNNATSGCTREYNCSVAATSSSSPSSSRTSGKGPRNRSNAFAY